MYFATGTHLLIFCIILSIVNFTACTGQHDEAESSTYYFIFNDKVQSEASRRLISEVESLLPKYHYYISTKSARAWPYFESVSINKKISIHDLLPPHTNYHRMVRFRQASQLNGRGKRYKIEFQLSKYDREQLIIQSEIFRKSVGSLEIWSKPAPTIERVSTFSSIKDLAGHLSKKLIRDTFK